MKIHAKASEKGVKSLDAPVSGAALGAESGRLVSMVGGDKRDLDEI